MLNLRSLYQKHIEQQGYAADAAQLAVVERLQILHDDWRRHWRGGRLSKLLGRRPPQHAGFYLWGGVGCGKTMLLDLFFRHVDVRPSQRLHFHAFMRSAHQRLATLKNKPDPLRHIARLLARQAKALFLDEFQVHDIGDAMILAELLHSLCDRQMLILISSNHRPSELYRDGLQRARFLPTIDLLEERFCVMELASPHDYRLNYIHQAGLYRAPHDAEAEAWLEESFRRLSGGTKSHRQEVTINGRAIRTVAHCGHCVWFRFSELCDTPRSAADYLEIASLFETVLLSEIPLLTGKDDIVRRFINLVDALYDCKVRLIASAADFAKSLYADDGRHSQDFKRAASRLTEMQSDAYWQCNHAFSN